MGMCSSDPLGYLNNTYGDDVYKYIVSLKAEQYLDQAIPNLIQNINQKFLNCSIQLNHQFDTKQKKIRNYFDHTLSQTLKQSKAALEGIKLRENKNSEEIFGLNQIHQRLIKLRLNKDQKLQSHRQLVLRKLNEKKTNLKKQILEKRPKLPILQQMPFWLKSQVQEEGASAYAREIKMQEERLLNILQRSISLEKLEDFIRQEGGIEQAHELDRAAQTAFERIKRNLAYYNNSRSCFI